MSTSRNILHPGLTLPEINDVGDDDARSVHSDASDEDEEVRVISWEEMPAARGPADSPVAVPAMQNQQPFPFEKLPDDIQAKIFRLWLVCHTSVHAIQSWQTQIEKANPVYRPRRTS